MVYATQNGFHAKQASNREPCLSCGESDRCYLISDPTGDIYRIICGRTPADSAPEGWRYYGQSTDNRQKFIRSDYRRRRQSKKYPARVELAPQPKHDIPQWQDVPAPPLSEVKKGHLVILKPEVSLGNLSQVYQIIDLKLQKSTGTLRATLQSAGDIDSTTITVDLKDIKEVVCRDDKGREQFIEYIYAENLKVVRTQWSDRRPVYQGKQTKKVRPWHINKDGKWTEGKGDIDFPLYHQDEAEEAINNGGIVFVAPGEQAVEAARSLGLTATYCIGGEKNVRTIATKLSPTFQNVSRLREADAGDTGVVHVNFL